jgi:hypothetical protein
MNYARYSTIRRRAGMRGLRISVLLSLVVLAGCVVYGPVPPQLPPEPVYSYRHSTFEHSWNAAQDAMEDVGVRIVSADRGSGIIRGIRDAADATIVVRTQADGRVRVEFSARGPSAQDHNLAGRIYQAYERRMGR